MDYQRIGQSALFAGIAEKEIAAMLACLSASTKSYAKGAIIYQTGENIARVGEVIRGRIHIIQEDFWGNRSIIAALGTGQIFGETYAAVTAAPLEVSVLAAADSNILFLDLKRIITTCPNACSFHAKLIHNLLAVTAARNLLLTRKLACMAQRTTRQKLLSYLSSEARRQKSASFAIDFNRQQLADFLAVDRSAMSSELGKLRDEGLLKFNRQKFELQDQKAPFD
jgi:CRP-like cAMP-binding protein